MERMDMQARKYVFRKIQPGGRPEAEAEEEEESGTLQGRSFSNAIKEINKRR